MEDAWVRFRFGQTAAAPFPATQFPVAAAKEWAKQITPMTSFPVIPNPNPTVMALSDLATKLKGAVIVGHSQSGFYGFNALLSGATGIRGLVNIEPGAPPASDCSDYKDEQIPTLAKVPILFVFADHLDAPAVTARLAGFNSCKVLITRINAANGKAQMLSLPEVGMLGNSHMLMQDRNNLAVADLILKWIAQNVDNR
jgi:pimeloyl-ACP methyl ester carboxylesterase